MKFWTWVAMVLWFSLFFLACTGVARVCLGNPIALLEQQHDELIAASQENAKSTTAYARLEADYEHLSHKWYVRWGQRIDTAIWILVGLGALGVGLRIFSQFGGGWIGSAAAFVSTGIFGILSGGISLIQTLFDNIHFRRKLAAVPAGGKSA